VAQVNVPRRSYRSPRREQQAIETRLAILDAAQALFEREGYAATTIESIATEAAVSIKTVYIAFVTKSALLRSVWDRAIKGDADTTPLSERQWYRDLLAEPNPKRQIELVASEGCSLKERTALLLRAIRSAAAVDPDGAELWRSIQSDYYESTRAIANAIASHGGLRPGLDVDTAADIMWTLNHPDVWLLLTGERHWTRPTFEAWFRDTMVQQLLGLSGGQSEST
jgi:AcrR family transcriptional regulator